MEGVGLIVHDYQQSCPRSITDRLVQGFELCANNRLGLPDEFVCVLCFDDCITKSEIMRQGKESLHKARGLSK